MTAVNSPTVRGCSGLMMKNISITSRSQEVSLYSDVEFQKSVSLKEMAAVGSDITDLVHISMFSLEHRKVKNDQTSFQNITGTRSDLQNHPAVTSHQTLWFSG